MPGDIVKYESFILAYKEKKLIMNRYLSKMMVAACAVFFAFTLKAAYEEVNISKYPDADCVLIEEREYTEYKSDGTYKTEGLSKIKVLTEKGRREESVISLGFNARYGSARIVEVLVESLDGSVRKVDISKTTKETTDNSSVSANIYDPMDRQIVCTVPALKIGDVITYKTERKTFMARVKDHYADIGVLEWKCPILSYSLTIKAPKDRPLKKMAVRNPIGNVKYDSKAESDGSVIHTWTAKDSPQAFEEPDMPPMYKQVQNVQVSTVGSWQELSKWYWDLSLPHLSKTTPAISNCVANIVSSLGKDADDIAKIGAIYKWVAQEVRYMGLTMEETSPGYAPHDVDVTFDNRYGVCRDKAALLVAMLRIAGFEAYPVLIHAGAKMDEEVPLPYFNHAITAVRAPGSKYANKAGYILMDATDESSRDIMPAYLGDRSYLVAAPFGEKLLVSEVQSAEDNGVFIASRGTLEKNGSMVVESTVEFKGMSDTVYRQALLRRKSDDRRKMFENIILRESSSAELLSFELYPADLRRTEEALKAKMVYRINEVLLKGDSCDQLMIPQLSRIIGTVNWVLEGSTSLEKRRFPLVLSSTALVDENLSIRLGEEIGAVKSLPEKISIKGAYSYDRSYSVESGVLTFNRRAAINAVEFSSSEYSDLRESLKRFESAERDLPVFFKNGNANANVHFRNIERYINVMSQSEWVVTNIYEKEILTYDGKKKSAELKFSYNPTWKTVEVLKAEVIKKDGTAVAASDREKTILDCGWAASAPRYPATKELIVNLPSVEIGSVIKYVTVTKVTNAPVPFYAVWNFDVSEPVDRMVIDYRDYKGGKFFREARNLKRIPSEPMQAPYHAWCDLKTVSLGDWTEASARLRKAADVNASDFALTLFAPGASDDEKILAVRNWMTRNIKVFGPGLYEVPLAEQLTDPGKVLEERYAAHLDYIRTMCALMKGAGLDADIVFAANDAAIHPDDYARDTVEFPLVGKYSIPFCRIFKKEGGFMGIGAKRKVYAFIGRENEYAPLRASVFAFSSYLDPATGEFLKIPVEDELASRTRTTYKFHVRENGSVDIDVAEMMYGGFVGTFRKFYSEMLPEERSRHFQEQLGVLSQAASATSDLITDVKSYPFKMSFSAYVPKYAALSGDMLTISFPDVGSALFPLAGNVRTTPIGLPGSTSHEAVTIEAVFPEGYTEIEHLPESFVVNVDGREFRRFTVSSGKTDKGCVRVTLEEVSGPGAALRLGRENFALLKEFSRSASSRANRTVVVRKKAK